MSKIPIQNIYYLLSYAWDTLDEAELVNAGIDDYDNALDLLGKVLVNGCRYLFKRGLYRNYHQVDEELVGVRGRVLVDQSIKSMTHVNKKLWCAHDEFSRDILHNQILKSTILRLLRTKNVDAKIYSSLKKLYLRFDNVNYKELQRSDFTKVEIHRNNYFYRLLIEICKLIFESTTISEDRTDFIFRDFTRDHRRLARLFQAFVFNFYMKEQHHFRVYSNRFKWPFQSFEGEFDDLLPTMNTDIVLEDEKEIIVIDTKFYHNVFTVREEYDLVRFKSPNLYQLYAYMQHIPNPENKEVNGMLLYPHNGDSVAAQYEYLGQKILFKTVDLNQDWKIIEGDLKAVVLSN